MVNHLPEKILWRKKSPYPKTYDPQYQTIMLNRLSEILEKPNARIWQIIKTDAVSSTVNTDSPYPWYGQLMRTPQFIAYILQLNYWLEKYHLALPL